MEYESPTIYTTRSGHQICCDPIDSGILNSRKWYANKAGSMQARSDSPVKGTYLHRLIAESIKPSKSISRIGFLDGNGLNCTRSNLRISLDAEVLMDQIIFDDGVVGFFDPEDRDTVIQFGPWIVFHADENHKYARQSAINGKFLHRILTNAPEKLLVDHVNRNTLDNRKINLRIANHHQNAGNQAIDKRNTSGYRGVSFIKSHGKWRASIKENGSVRTIGGFNTPEEAARVYDEAAKRVFGAFANLNFPEKKAA